MRDEEGDEGDELYEYRETIEDKIARYVPRHELRHVLRDWWLGDGLQDSLLS